ncbi:MAG: TM2 domain-containing protein [Clostridia bacterium]|nr:TM2 domain-containing protein [Clostridia bacterium]
MDSLTVDRYLEYTHGYFPAKNLPVIRQALLSMNEERFAIVVATQLHDPLSILLVSLFLGALGIDRFLLKDYRMGLFKLLTSWIVLITPLIDLFFIRARARRKNYLLLAAFFD